jgi:hypothetical protein
MAERKAKKGQAVKGRKPVRRVRQNETEKPAWNEQKEQAALLVAQDKLSDELIAAELGIGRATLARWKVESDFRARVSEIVVEIKARVVARGIAERQNRLDALNDRWHKMKAVISQRATNLASVPGGGNTGLLVRQVKGIGKGEDFQVIEEYAVDTGLLREMREHEKHAAIELGEWTEKREHKFNLSDLSNEELITLERITAKLT